MNTPAHVIGYNSSTSALVARCSIDVWDDRRMMRDSANANSIKTTMLGIDNARNRAYKSVVRDPGSSLIASFLANSRSSLTATSTCVFEDTGLRASAHRFTTYLSSGCHIPIFGELGGTLRTPPSVIGTTTARSHSFQKLVSDGSRPRMP